MKYQYKCENPDCVMHDVVIDITKPMSEVTKKEHCEYCKSVMVRVYSLHIKTGDGIK